MAKKKSDVPAEKTNAAPALTFTLDAQAMGLRAYQSALAALRDALAGTGQAETVRGIYAAMSAARERQHGGAR